ncbi:MAG: Transcriptional regulator [Candidatus Magasanikbacteria bacterium GW2011_GWC2_40_17]|uniref:Transcriptional regulator n=1 Tax=Candidatus Magasanikbacteria bacterium GW2011_GWA2_42_32 TaxID=1619039 RepID=A0A0G1D423_9BACT|nr:MAG: Transcriptional regulator [Candidatus Magasanikbacteria bacterium GW2011_GWC2_40_17]KKS56763.1 MAG: Transcriptional regulator [Candidatus Magasanikbacteria bacterium GW2011_GWA2_42_32]OGH86048.1 MAG: hypothetical protein A2294_02175 [Candidatus Magasanikbacteria bacterium RIFOXYB2_FULL_38_10]
MSEIDLNLMQSQEKPKRKIWRYIFLFLTLAIFFLIIGGIKGWFKESPREVGLVQPKPNLLTQIKNLILSRERGLKGEETDRINILILGIGGEEHDGPYLSDTIILASLKPSTNQVALFSIPRDLLVEIPGYGFGKINAADAFGEAREKGYGPILASEVIGKTLNQPIDYYLRIDFSAFKEMVDAVGGVKINVEKSFTDAFYPTYDYKYQTISFEKGWQNMDGETALKFTRSRHGTNGENSDFARSRRQQKIILALKDKIFSSASLWHPGRVQNLMDSLNAHVNTNVELWEISRFFELSKKLDYQNIINLVLGVGPNQPLMASYYNSAEVLRPREGNFSKLQKLAEDIFQPDTAKLASPAFTGKIEDKKFPIIEIQNGTWVLGLGSRVRQTIEEQGVLVNILGNATLRDQEKTVIYDLSSGKFKKEMDIIKKQLKEAEIKTTSQAPFSSSSTPDILIIVGANQNI